MFYCHRLILSCIPGYKNETALLLLVKMETLMLSDLEPFVFLTQCINCFKIKFMDLLRSNKQKNADLLDKYFV